MGQHAFTSPNSTELIMSNNQKLFMRARLFFYVCHWFDSVMHLGVWSLRQNALRKWQMYFIFNNMDFSLLSHRLEFKHTGTTLDFHVHNKVQTLTNIYMVRSLAIFPLNSLGRSSYNLGVKSFHPDGDLWKNLLPKLCWLHSYSSL